MGEGGGRQWVEEEGDRVAKSPNWDRRQAPPARSAVRLWRERFTAPCLTGRCNRRAAPGRWVRVGDVVWRRSRLTA
jgi:hypothetical protein